MSSTASRKVAGRWRAPPPNPKHRGGSTQAAPKLPHGRPGSSGSSGPSTGRSTRGRAMTTATIDQLLAEKRYAQERYDLYKAKAYSGRPVNASRLRELERAAHGANSRLRRARATAERHAARAGSEYTRVPRAGAPGEQPEHDSPAAPDQPKRVPRGRRLSRAVGAKGAL